MLWASIIKNSTKSGGQVDNDGIHRLALCLLLDASFSLGAGGRESGRTGADEREGERAGGRAGGQARAAKERAGKRTHDAFLRLSRFPGGIQTRLSRGLASKCILPSPICCSMRVPFLWPWRAGEVPPRVVCCCLVLGGFSSYPGETMRQSYVFARFGCFQVISWRNHASELC